MADGRGEFDGVDFVPAAGLVARVVDPGAGDDEHVTGVQVAAEGGVFVGWAGVVVGADSGSDGEAENAKNGENSRQDGAERSGYEDADHVRGDGNGERDSGGEKQVVDAGAFELAVERPCGLPRGLVGSGVTGVGHTDAVSCRLFGDEEAVGGAGFDGGLGIAGVVRGNEEAEAVVGVDAVGEGIEVGREGVDDHTDCELIAAARDWFGGGGKADEALVEEPVAVADGPCGGKDGDQGEQAPWRDERGECGEWSYGSCGDDCGLNVLARLVEVSGVDAGGVLLVGRISHDEPPLGDVDGEGDATGDSGGVEGVDVEDLIADEARRWCCRNRDWS